MKRRFSSVVAAGATTAVALAFVATTSAAVQSNGGIRSGDPKTSQHPQAGVTTTYDGQTVPAGGVEISPGNIAYDGGATILTLSTNGSGASSSAAANGSGASSSAAAQPNATANCTSGYVCLYADAGFGGRRLQFAQRGFCQSLTNYGFSDQTSSWANRQSSGYARLRDNTDCSGAYEDLSAGGSTGYVGDGFNDTASAIFIHT